MRLTDCIKLILQVFTHQKMRTMLTLTGVVIASCLLLISLSIREGMHEGVLKQFSIGDQMRVIRIGPIYGGNEGNRDNVQLTGEISAERRERLIKKFASKKNRQGYVPQFPLSSEKLDAIAALDHVESVVPDIDFYCHNFFGEHSDQGIVQGMHRNDKRFPPRIVAGEVFSSNDARQILVHEYLVYQWGFANDADVKNVIGKTVKLELQSRTRALANLVASNSGNPKELSLKEIQKLQAGAKKLESLVEQLKIPKNEKELLLKLFKMSQPSVVENSDEKQTEDIFEEFTIVGVFRDMNVKEEDDFPRFNSSPRNVDLVLPMTTARGVALKFPNRKKYGFDQAIVTVDKEQNLKEVAEKIEGMELNEFSMWEVVENIRKNVALIMFSMSVIATVAMIVSALGITNTMTMSVLERTHEIGVMKAIGARNAQIQAIFLLEGAFIGLLGGVLGLLAAWLAKFPGNAIAKSIMQKDFNVNYQESVFAYPLWMVVSVPLLAAVVTMLAAFYPARRAARIDPIEALRHG